MSTTDQWYYTRNGQQIGPVAADLLRSLIASGGVAGQDYVWREGMSQWLPASSVPEMWNAATPAYASPAAAYAVASPQGDPTTPMSYYTPARYQPHPTLPYAGFWLRFVAYIVDTIILFAVNFGIGLGVAFTIVGAASSGSGASRAQAGELAQLVANLIGLAVNFAYYTILESGPKQSTWGKRILGLRVTNEQGGPITYGQAVGRFFGKILSAIILCVGFMMAGWTARKQALHDTMAGTLVLR